MSNQPKSTGKAYRKGMSLVQAVRRFSDEKRTERWFIASRWEDGIICPICGTDRVSERKTKPDAPRQWRCKGKPKRHDFSIKTGTVMQGSNLKLGTWALAIYILTTNLKGESALKMRRDLDLSYKSAWHLAHRIRESWTDEIDIFGGSVEFDEVWVGGKERNKHESKKLHAGRGPVGKQPVVGAKERESGKVRAQVIEDATGGTLKGFVRSTTTPDATIYTDEASGYRGVNRKHEVVKHSVREYVRGQAHVNGVESFWASLRRGYQGTYHHFSTKHLQRYVNEFAGRHNTRPLDTEDQMRRIVVGMCGKRLRYKDLIGPKHTRQPQML